MTRPADVLAESRGAADSIALIGYERSWTFFELAAAVDARSAELVDHRRARSAESAAVADAGSVEPDDAEDGVGPVPLVVEPDAEGVIELLAFWRSGWVPALLNPKMTKAEDSRARARLAGATLPDGTQAVLWTSGTSGRPRGVALSWANLVANARGSEERLGLSADDTWLASLSPAHVGGLALVVRALFLGSSLIAVGPFDAARYASLLGCADDGVVPDAESRARTGRPTPAPRPTHLSLVPTHLSLVPTQLLRLMAACQGGQAPESVRCVLIGGAHAPSELIADALGQRWPIALTYGATEMSSQIATATPAQVRAKPGSVGRPMPGAELRVTDEGEILVRGETRALGHVGDDGAGAMTDDEGWVRTGDLGRIDEVGDLWITGRRIDRIVSGGVTVDAVEVEEAMRAHPSVIDCCVVGLPDDEWGERVGIWVEGVQGEADLEELEEYAREQMTDAKRPRSWYLGPGIPRNTNGKIDRAAVREALM